MIFSDVEELYQRIMCYEYQSAYIYVWKDHKYAGRKEISLEELKGYPCIAFDQSSNGNFYLAEEAMSDYHFDMVIKSDDRATGPVSRFSTK